MSWEADSKVQLRWTQGLKGSDSKNSKEEKNGVNSTKMDLILCVEFGAWGELEKSKHFKGRRMKIYALINK